MECKFKIKSLPFILFSIFFFQIISFFVPVAAETETLIPIGRTMGITLDVRGVIVTDTAYVTDFEGNKLAPAKEAGIEPGDSIEKINGNPVVSAKEFENVINENGASPINLTIQRDGKTKELTVKACLSCIDGFYRIGVWIKDAASGIGTITYVDASTKKFGALGHAISESPDSPPIPISGGQILEATIVSVKKGEKGTPGELIGVFTDDKEKLGRIISNDPIGIKGTLDDNVEIIENSKYSPESDLENTPDSVFCAHGGGFCVKWDKVPEYMHLESCMKKGRSERNVWWLSEVMLMMLST